jgi:hypothetical protein
MVCYIPCPVPSNEQVADLFSNAVGLCFLLLPRCLHGSNLGTRFCQLPLYTGSNLQLGQKRPAEKKAAASLEGQYTIAYVHASAY